MNVSGFATRYREKDVECIDKFENFENPGYWEMVASFLITWNAVSRAGASVAGVRTIILLFVTCGISFEEGGK